MQEIGITSATVEMKDVSDNLSVPGNVDIDEERLSYVQTRVSGWIQDVSANATYQYVRKGQQLFTVYSPDLVSSEQEYLLARQNKAAFSQDEHGMGTQDSGWLLKAAEERLLQFGVPAQTIADLEQTGKVQRNIPIFSPASGYVIERNALPNAYVQPDTKLYTIADLSTVWVYANVFQNDVGKLRPGDQGQVTVDAYPGRHFNGRIDQILPQVDMTTRTVRVRLVFSNPGVILKPGMYVNVAIAVKLGRQMVIPASAVLQTGTRAIAFVDHGDGKS
jgi:Cu(I)/Ag(I) efflux system membrane fusion protein/cobalt-zinc-cadmium efflux system membrane fusion protein